MKRSIVLAALALGLLAPTAALAGGWATAGVSPLPQGIGPGEQWKTKITLMQHGRTPLENVNPAIVVTDAAGKDTRFDARPAETPGVYDVTVVFPAPGKYEFTVDDDFGNAFPHQFAPVTVAKKAAAVPAAAKAPAAPSPAPSRDGGLPLGAWLLGGLALLLAGAAGVAVRRRRGTAPAARALAGS